MPNRPIKDIPFRILLVENDLAQAELIQMAIQSSNWSNLKITHLTDGEAAVDYLLRQGAFAQRSPLSDPCLVLLDLGLNLMTGTEVLKRIRAEPWLRTLSVVVLTSSNSPRDVEQAFASGANSYVEKPFDYDELIAMLDQLLTYWLRWNRPSASLNRPGSF